MTTPTTVQVRLQIRADTAANWTSVNPVLLDNELGLETDTKKFKIGDGNTSWQSLAYFPSIVSGGTVLGNLEIGTTGTLTFEGSTANGFETTLGVVDPTADRTILLPNQSGTVVVGGNASIVDADIAANAEIAVSKLADGAARQLLQTDAAGTGVEWTSNIDIPGTLDVTGAATFDGAVTVAGDLTVNGTTTTISTQNLLVEDKNIILGDVATPTDTTADGGGITLKGATDKTINWIDSTDAWTSSERFSVPLGSAAAPSLTFTGDENTGIYSPGADQVAISTNSTGRLFIDSSGRVGVGIASPTTALHAKGIVRAHRSDDTNARYTQISFEGGTASLDSVRDDGQFESLTFRQSSNGGSSYTERMRLDSSGRLGIGTSSPVSMLSVSDSSTLTTTGISDCVGITLRNTSNTVGNYTSIQNRDASGDQNAEIKFFNITQDTTLQGAIAFTTRSAAGEFAEKMRLSPEGRLGIGTTSPSATLHVATVGNPEVLIGGTQTPILSFVGGVGSEPVIGYGAGSLRIGTVTGAGAAGFSEKARFDTSGRLLVGTSSSITEQFSGNGRLQVATTVAYGISAFNYTNDVNECVFTLGKSRSITPGNHTIVQNGDSLAALRFQGSDGTAFIQAASIVAQVDGTPGANDMPGRLVFSTTADGASSPTERMRISNNGDFLIGQQTTSSPGSGNTTEGIGFEPRNGSIFLSRASAGAFYVNRNSDGTVCQFSRSGAGVGTISVTTTATAYNTSSDYRLKENVTPVTDSITRLQQLKPSRFNFIADPTKTVDGFIAHEVQTVVPECVTGEKDAVDAEGNPVYQGIDQSKLVPLLTAALQEAVAKIESLEARLTAAGI